jgi:hypothetical protein
LEELAPVRSREAKTVLIGELNIRFWDNRNWYGRFGPCRDGLARRHDFPSLTCVFLNCYAPRASEPDLHRRKQPSGYGSHNPLLRSASLASGAWMLRNSLPFAEFIASGQRNSFGNSHVKCDCYTSVTRGPTCKNLANVLNSK